MLQQKPIQLLSLYYYDACPFCRFVLTHLNEHQDKIKRKNILENPEYRNQLMHGGGKTQVPCLHIEYQSGDDFWLYESHDIIEFINQVPEEYWASV
jgi:glutaredoxin